MDERLPAHVEAAALLRRVEAEGGFGTVLRKGDPDRGSLILLIYERGQFCGTLERELAADFTYRWTHRPPPENSGSVRIDQFIGSRAQLDPDLWLIELDIAEPERFIAETTGLG